MIDVENNLQHVKQLIADYEKKYQRETGCVTLLAASKGQSIEKITAAFHAGQRVFGENYLQEALEKMSALGPALTEKIEWHFIGPVQSNKTRKIAEHFAWVHSIDDKKIAQRLNDQRPSSLPPLNICIEVNVSHEDSKSGVSLNEVMALAQFCHTLPRLHLRGLMAIPAAYSQIEKQRGEFHKLLLLSQTLREQGLAIDTLSMGMSQDFEAAIAEGATIIRVGSALFGKRA